MEEVIELHQKGEFIAVFHMLMKLAQQGNLDAMYVLRKHLSQPHQDHANIVMAYMISCVCVIVSKGDVDAKMEMDRLAKQLTEEEKRQAEKIAEVFIHQPPETLYASRIR